MIDLIMKMQRHTFKIKYSYTKKFNVYKSRGRHLFLKFLCLKETSFIQEVCLVITILK
jgi:hypothetical protein